MCASLSLPVAIKSSSSDRKWVSVVVSSETTLLTTSRSHNIDMPGEVLPFISPQHSPSPRPCCTHLRYLLQATILFRYLLHVTNMLAYLLVPIAFLYTSNHTPLHHTAYWCAIIHDIYFFAGVSLLCKHDNRSLTEWLFNCFLVIPFWLVYECLATTRLVRHHIDVGLFIYRCWSLPVRLYWTSWPWYSLKTSLHHLLLLLVILLLGHGVSIVVRCTWLLYMNLAISYFSSFYIGTSLLLGDGVHIVSSVPPTIIILLLILGSFLTLLWHTFVFFSVYNRRKRSVALHHVTSTLIEHVQASSSSRKLLRMLRHNARNRMLHDEPSLDPQAQLMRLCNWSLLQDVLFDVRLPAVRACAFIHALKHHDAIDSFVRHLSTLTLFETLNTGEHVCERGHPVDRMCVIIDGRVDVLAADDDTTPLMTLSMGACISHVALFLRVRARATLRCRTHVRLLTLARADFLVGTLDAHSALYRLMRRNCNQLLADARRRHRSTMVTHAQRQRHLPVAAASTIDDDVIHLHRRLQELWNAFVTAAAVLVAVTYPYYIAVRRSFPTWFHSWLATPIEVVFVADWLLGVLQVAAAWRWRCKPSVRWRCARITQHWSFYVDFCACVYLEHIVYEVASGSVHQRDFLYYVGKLNRVLKVYKLFYHLEQLPTTWRTTTKRLLLAVLYNLLLAYLTAMVYMLIACFHVPCAVGSWIRRQAVAEMRANASATLRDAPMMAALQMALNALLRTDSGSQVEEENVLENVLGIVTALGGYLLFAWFTMEAATLSYLQRRPEMARRADVCDMRHLAAMFPARLQRRLLAFYELQCIGIPYTLTQSPASGYLSRHLASALLLQQRVDDLMHVPFVGHVGRRFADLLALKSKLYLLPAHDTLTHMGNMNKEMFVLTRGYCAYKTKDSYYKRMGPIGTKARGAYFGMVSILFNLPEVFTVRTLTPCVFISIDGSALQEALRHYPHVNAIIRDVLRSGMYVDLVEEGKQMAYAHLEPSSIEEDVTSTKVIAACKVLNEDNLVNVLSYCRQRREDYRQPFKRADLMPMVYFTLPLVIIPWGLFYRCWMVLRICVAFAYGFLPPLAFILPANNPTLFVINIFCDVVVYVDFLIQAYVSYANAQGVLVVHPLQTMRNYRNNGLIVDILIAFPYAWIAHPDHFLRLRCICMLQVIKFFAYLSHLNTHKVHLLKCLCWITLIAHCFACILVANECQPMLVSGSNTLMCSHQNWITRSKYALNFYRINPRMIQAPVFDVYLLAFYWSICILSAINWRDMIVQSATVLKIRLVLLCISVFLHGYFLKLLLSVWLTSETTMKTWRKLDFRFKLLQLRRFLERHRASKELMAKFNKNASFFWKRTRGIDRTLVLSHLHTTLLQDSLAILYEGTLRQVPLFQDMDKAFLRIVSLIARPLYFLPGQVIVNVEDVCDEFYIIHEGIVHVELARSSYRINLSRGSLLGYYSKETTPLMSIVARSTTYVDVLCIKSIDYFNILKNYRKFDNELKNVLSEYKDFIPNRNVEDNMVNVMISKKRNEVKWIRMVNSILQNKMFHSCCDTIIFLMAFINLLIIAFNFIAPHVITVYCNCFVDMCFVLHFGLHFVKPFYNERCELITNYSMIRKQIALKRKIIIAETILMVLVNFSYIFLIGSQLRFILIFGEPLAVFAKARLIALYRCKYLRRRSFEPDGHFVHLESILRLIIGVIIALHTFACVWCVITIYGGPKKYWTLDEKMSLYLESCLLATNVLHSTATFKLVPTNRIEMITLIVSMIAMRIYICFLIYNLICYLWMCLKPILRFNLLLNEIVKCLQALRTNKFQIRMLTRHLVRMQTFEFGCNFPVILSLLPSQLVYELKVALYQNLLEKSYIFHGTQANFQRNIAVHLQRAVYFDGEVIIHVGEMNKCMYFIHDGSVEIISVNDNHTETRHDVLHAYEMFGLGQGLFRMPMPHQFTFKARQRVEILTLHLEHWEHLLRFFPKSKDIIYNRIRTLQL